MVSSGMAANTDLQSHWTLVGPQHASDVETDRLNMDADADEQCSCMKASADTVTS